MAGEALLATRFAAIALLLALAAWLLAVRFTNPVNRAFALVMVVLALKNLAFRLAEVTGEAYWAGLGGYFALAVVPLLGYFLVVHAGPPRLGASRVRWMLLGLAGLVGLVYAMDHCLYRCLAPSGRVALGPLALLGFGDGLAFGLAAMFLAQRARRAPSGERARAERLMSMAFVLLAVIVASIQLGVVANLGLAGAVGFFQPSPWAAPAVAAGLLAMAPCAVAFALWRAPPGRARAAALTLAAGATGFLVGFRPGDYAPAGSALLGVWQLVFLGLVVVSIVRHQLFDLDVRLRWTVKQSTVAAVFIGTFFVVGEAAQNLLSESLGPYLGIAAAGLLVFALAPLQHAAERLARSAVPVEDHAAPEGRAGRVAAFRAAVELALADGVVNRAEERALTRLAERLGLAPAEALRVREEAARAALREARAAAPRR